MRLDNETLKKRLRYQGQQYGNGQAARGGGREPHILEQAEDRIEELEAGIRMCHGMLMDSVRTHGTEGCWLDQEATRLYALLTPNAKAQGREPLRGEASPGATGSAAHGE